MIRLVRSKTWREAQAKIKAQEEELVSLRAKAEFLEKGGTELAEKTRQLTDMLGKCATWLLANILAAHGRTKRILTAREIANAVGYDLGAEPAKDGGVQISVIPKAAKGLPLPAGHMMLVGSSPDANPKPKTVGPDAPPDGGPKDPIPFPAQAAAAKQESGKP